MEQSSIALPCTSSNNTPGSFSEPLNFASSSQYELQSGEFAPEGRELSALKPKNSPPLAGCFWAGFQNENCCNFACASRTQN